MDITQGKYRPIELLRYAGLFLWFCAGIPLLLMRWIYPQPLPLELYIGWFMLHGLFGLMYWNMVQYLPEHTTISHRLLYLSVLTSITLRKVYHHQRLIPAPVTRIPHGGVNADAAAQQA